MHYSPLIFLTTLFIANASISMIQESKNEELTLINKWKDLIPFAGYIVAFRQLTLTRYQNVDDSFVVGEDPCLRFALLDKYPYKSRTYDELVSFWMSRIMKHEGTDGLCILNSSSIGNSNIFSKELLLMRFATTPEINCICSALEKKEAFLLDCRFTNRQHSLKDVYAAAEAQRLLNEDGE